MALRQANVWRPEKALARHASVKSTTTAPTGHGPMRWCDWEPGPRNRSSVMALL